MFCLALRLPLVEDVQLDSAWFTMLTNSYWNMNPDTDFKELVCWVRRNIPEKATKKWKANAKEPEVKKSPNYWVISTIPLLMLENKKMLTLNLSSLKIDTIIIKINNSIHNFSYIFLISMYLPYKKIRQQYYLHIWIRLPFL